MSALYTPQERVYLALSTAFLILSGDVVYAKQPNDKAQHFIAGAAVGSIAQALTDSVTVGCLAGIAAGLAKEAYDGKRANASDALVTAAGGCLAAKFSGWTFGPGRVTYRKEF